jgi:hypothetical protein
MALLKSIIDQQIFIEIDKEVLYLTQNFTISESTVERLKAVVDEKMRGGHYISLNNFKGYEHILPPIGFFWNPYLLKSILLGCGYRQIKKILHDDQYDKVILVKEDSNIKTFEDLIVHIMGKEFQGFIPENDIYDFLAKKGILPEQEREDQKFLPYEIKTSKKFVFDKMGRLEVR